MKHLFIGLLVGFLLCGGVCYIMMRGMTQDSYDKGYAIGIKEGMAAGMAEGMAKGAAQVLAEQKREQDSVALAGQNQAAAQRKAAQKPRKTGPTQNWRVEGGKIMEPLP